MGEMAYARARCAGAQAHTREEAHFLEDSSSLKPDVLLGIASPSSKNDISKPGNHRVRE
jgi:hypothetical protein